MVSPPDMPHIAAELRNSVVGLPDKVKFATYYRIASSLKYFLSKDQTDLLANVFAIGDKPDLIVCLTCIRIGLQPLPTFLRTHTTSAPPSKHLQPNTFPFSTSRPTAQCF